MSGKTKIVVLHVKEVIASIIVMIMILVVILLLFRGVWNDKCIEKVENSQTNIEKYNTEIVIGADSIELEISVEEGDIKSIEMVNVSEDTLTMYPLLEPTLSSIIQQINEGQSLDNISYTADNKYTSLVLIEAIHNTLDNALSANAHQNESTQDY